MTNLQLSARNAGSIIDDDRVQGVAFTGSNKGGVLFASVHLSEKNRADLATSP